MGVQGLWQLLHPAGKPVSPSSLEGKVLAVDVSIWLHQTMKGMRDRDGNPLPNAHLQGLFSRVCKLLFYRIRPVFVFDGGVPALKKQTMAFRRERKENVEREKGRMTKKLVENLLQTHAVRGLTGERSDYQDQPSRRRGAEPDMFELPPMPDVDEGSTDAAESMSFWEPDADLEDEHGETYQSFREDLQNLEDVDTDSPEFQSLPPEIRHEILSEMKEQRRENALARIAIMPEDSKDFSDYQLKKLIKQSRLSGQIESVRKEMNNKVSKDITYALGDNYYGEFVEANRVVSEDAAHYVLIRGLTRKQQVAEAERCRERRLSREERRLEQNPDKKDLTLDAETAELRDKDDVSDQEEADMEWDIRVKNRANRRILSDDEDDETSDESHRKRRRGKSLVTRKGLRSVAKSGKGRSAAKRFSVVEEDEEGVLSDAALVEAVSTAEKAHTKKLNLEKEDIVVKSEDLLGSTPPAPVNTSLLPADRSFVPSDVSPMPVKTSAITVNMHDTCANTGSVPGNKSLLPVKNLPVSQRTSSTMGATDTVKVEVVDDSDTEESLKTWQDVCHRNEGSSQQSKKSGGRECVNDAREAADTGDTLDHCLQEEQDAQIVSISPSPDEQSAEKGSKFAETQNRLLREEEHLNKAKEDKRAALLKSLEKRRHIVESSPAETPASGEDVSHQEEQQELLLKQEEDLMKEKDLKMAALLQAVEKRSGLHTESVPVSEGSDTPGDLPSSKARKRGKRKRTTEVNSGFLEDVADLERKAVQRKIKSRLAKPTLLSTETSAASPSSPSRSEAVPQAVPALTIDYLEDVESTAESDKKRGEDMLSSAGNSDVHSRMTSSVEDLLPQDSSTLTSSLKCDELFQDASIRSTERKQAVNSNREHHNPASRQEGTKSTESQRNERATEDLKFEGTDMSEVHRTEAPEGTGGDGSEKDREEPLEHHPPLLEEQEDSEDEGFIEVTFNPSSVPEDDLFPASIFATETPPGGTALANDAGDGHTTHNQLSTSCVSDDGVKETTESDVVRGEVVVHSDDMLEPKVVEEEDAHSDDMLEPKVVEEGDVHSDDMLEPKVVEEEDAHSDDMLEPKVVEEGDVHSDDMLEPKVVEEEDAHSDDMLEPKVVEEGDVNSSYQEKRERPSLPVSSLDKDKAGKRGEGRKLSVESVQEDKASNFSKGVDALPDLYNLQRELTREQKTLRLERGRQARLGKSVTEQINMEAQELLQLFGVPYVVGPMEAEAQCAHLELTGLTQGTITDDSDAWLFGASNIYKNFFNNAKYVEFYSADAVWNRFGLDRRKLINVALLCGSDYTPGIPGVGPVRAIEIMAEFPGEGLEGLRSFRNWWEDARAGVLPRSQGQIKNKLRSLDLHEGFPSRQVVDAYLRPEVDESEEAFTWGLPDVDLLQQYAKQKFGWNRQKADDVLEPMMKELTKKVSQGRIHSYFQPENFIPAKPVKSKRLQMALDKFQEGENSESESSESESESESGSGSGSESGESPPELTKRDKITVPKPKQNVSGSTTRGRGRGTSRGKRGGKTEAPTLPELGESIIEKANQILSGSSHRGRGTSRGKRGKKAGAATKGDNSETGDVKSNAPGVDKAMRGRGRGRGGERGQGRRESGGKRTANPYVGKNENPNQRRQKVVLKEEVSLSESSSSSDDDESKPKKSRMESVKFAARVPPKQSVSVSKMQKSAAGKRKTNVPNVKQLKPASAKSTTVKRKLQDDSRAKASALREDVTAFKEAVGGDLDPSTMTLNDLGSDFSD